MGKTIIRPGEGNFTGFFPLVPFNMLFDTDFGLMKVIYKDYMDPAVFDVDWFKEHNQIRKMTIALYHREIPNPLSVCVNDKEIQDELYHDFITGAYNDILNTSIGTEFNTLLRYWSMTKEIKPTILYSDERELEYMDQFRDLQSFPKVSLDKLFETIDRYTQFYFKSIYDDIYMDTIADSIFSKTVYLANYPFNRSQIFITLSTALQEITSKPNDIKLIDIYSEEKLNIGGNEDDNE